MPNPLTRKRLTLYATAGTPALHRQHAQYVRELEPFECDVDDAGQSVVGTAQPGNHRRSGWVHKYDGTIADIGDVIGGATPSKKKPEYYCSDGIGWITPRDLSNTTDKFIAHGADDVTQLGYDSCSVKTLPAGTVLFSSRAPIGYIAIATGHVTANQGFRSVVPHEDIGTAFWAPCQSVFSRLLVVDI